MERRDKDGHPCRRQIKARDTSGHITVLFIYLQNDLVLSVLNDVVLLQSVAMFVSNIRNKYV